MIERFSQRLRIYRRMKGYKQEALAHDWGYSVETISAWEREKRQPGAQEIPHIAELLGISVKELVRSIEAQENGEASLPNHAPPLPNASHPPHPLHTPHTPHLSIGHGELVQVYQNRMAFSHDYSYEELFKQAHEILIVGISLNDIAMQYPREKIVELLTENQCSLTLCFLDPNGTYCTIREQEEKRRDGRLRDLIQLNIENIEATIATLPPERMHQVRLFTYDSPSRFNICLIDDAFLTAQFYMYARGEDTPLYVYQRREPHGLFEFYASAARHVLEHAKPRNVPPL